MVGIHCGQRMLTISDSVLEFTRECRVCHRKFTQRKRQRNELAELGKILLAGDALTKELKEFLQFLIKIGATDLTKIDPDSVIDQWITTSGDESLIGK